MCARWCTAIEALAPLAVLVIFLVGWVWLCCFGGGLLLFVPSGNPRRKRGGKSARYACGVWKVQLYIFFRSSCVNGWVERV